MAFTADSGAGILMRSSFMDEVDMDWDMDWDMGDTLFTSEDVETMLDCFRNDEGFNEPDITDTEVAFVAAPFKEPDITDTEAAFVAAPFKEPDITDTEAAFVDGSLKEPGGKAEAEAAAATAAATDPVPQQRIFMLRICHSLTHFGTPCNNYARIGTEYCHFHKYTGPQPGTASAVIDLTGDPDPEAEPAVFAKGFCQSLTHFGNPCNNFPCIGTEYCRFHN
jgi:hypothetical protein